MSETSGRNRTNAEIEALLREGAAGEIRSSDGRVSRRVVTHLRSDTGLRARGSSMRLGALLDDDGAVPRWFLAAAVIAISALAGWLIFSPGPATHSGPAQAPITKTFPDPSIFDVSAGRILAMTIEPQGERFKREARALVGAGWELAGRVLGGIPVELVKPMAERRANG